MKKDSLFNPDERIVLIMGLALFIGALLLGAIGVRCVMSAQNPNPVLQQEQKALSLERLEEPEAWKPHSPQRN